MSTVTILGSGRAGSTLANRLATAGLAVVVGTRDPAATAADWKGEPVINATPGDTALERLSALDEELHGKILVDVSNATERSADGSPGSLLYPGSSLAEKLQEALPGVHIVKTLNTMLFSVMADPHSLATAPTAFLSGNDAAAKESVRDLLSKLGWPPAWVEDLGDVTSARGTEALILLVPHIIRSRGFVPFALTVAGVR
jgi:predicted dinucleotide-binding enzyme